MNSLRWVGRPSPSVGALCKTWGRRRPGATPSRDHGDEERRTEVFVKAAAVGARNAARHRSDDSPAELT